MIWVFDFTLNTMTLLGLTLAGFAGIGLSILFRFPALLAPVFGLLVAAALRRFLLVARIAAAVGVGRLAGGVATGLGLRLLLLGQFAQPRQVEGGVGVPRVALQRLAVGCHGGFEALRGGPRVAAVVPVVGPVEAGQGRLGFLVAPGPEQRGGLPARVVELLGGGIVLARLQALVGALVVVAPEGVEVERLGPRQWRQQPGQQHQVAAPEGQRRQRQQRQQQPGADLAPMLDRAVLDLPALRRQRAGGAQQRADVAVVGAEPAVEAVAGFRQCAQARLVQRRHDDVAVRVLEEAGVAVERNGRTFGRADAQHQQLVRAVGQDRFGLRFQAVAVADQQQAAGGDAGALEQFAGQLQGRQQAAALDRHQARFQALDHVHYRDRIVAQRRRQPSRRCCSRSASL